MEKREPSCTVAGNVNWCSQYGEQYGGSSELPYDPAIPLLGTHPDKTIIQKDTRTPVFIAALFTIAKTWKQSKCPSTDEWIKKMWWASLVAQWLRVCLPIQGTRVRALVWEDPTCRGATRPVSHNYCACASGACGPQQERPR